MGTIYKITNKINQKIYIGKTIRPVKIRWQEHIREALYEQDNIPLHNAIKKYGINSFTFEVLQDNLKEEELNEYEQKFITQYQSLTIQSGYNITKGGDGGRTSSKLTEKDIQEIIAILQDKNNPMSLSEIAALYNISKSVIINLNNGNTWVQENINYPIRKFISTQISISREEYAKIVNEIQNSSLLLKDIQNKYNLSEGQMTAINQGQHCYHNKENSFYYGLYNGTFPIRKTNQKIDKDISVFKNIFYDILFTKDSMSKIGVKYNISGNTLQYISSGKRRKELTQDFILPMRKNIIENQKIFLELFPEFKEVD